MSVPWRPPTGAFLLPAPRSWTPRTCAGPRGAWRTRSSSAIPRPAELVLVGLQTGGVWIAGAAGPDHRRGHRRGRGHGHPGRGLLPRRHRSAAGAARGDHGHPRGPDRADRGAGRRRALHRRTIRAALNALGRLRAGPGGAAGGHGRPGPPGAADPTRLRRAKICRPGATRWSTPRGGRGDRGIAHRERDRTAADRRPPGRRLDNARIPGGAGRHLLSIGDLGAEGSRRCSG